MTYYEEILTGISIEILTGISIEIPLSSTMTSNCVNRDKNLAFKPLNRDYFRKFDDVSGY
jgi:hypothetical protein